MNGVLEKGEYDVEKFRVLCVDYCSARAELREVNKSLSGLRKQREACRVAIGRGCDGVADVS